MMRFKILGPMEIVTDDQRSIPLNASKMAQILALLLVRRHEIVSANTLVEELWGERPPRSALATVQTYIYHARRMFSREGIVSPTSPKDGLLITRSPGYSIRVDDHEADVWIFDSMVCRATASLDAGDPATALSELAQALTLWRGPAFSNISTGPVLDAHATHLAEIRLHAINMRIEALRQLGRYQAIVPELRSLVVSHPLNEFLHCQLIEALYRSGRRAEALQTYQRLRTILHLELGVEPAPEAQRLHLEVLNCGRVALT
jgi:DNA-binding SARP family transcriptional activator